MGTGTEYILSIYLFDFITLSSHYHNWLTVIVQGKRAAKQLTLVRRKIQLLACTYKEREIVCVVRLKGCGHSDGQLVF